MTVIDVFFAVASTLIVLPALTVWFGFRRESRHLARSHQRVIVKRKV